MVAELHPTLKLPLMSDEPTWGEATWKNSNEPKILRSVLSYTWDDHQLVMNPLVVMRPVLSPTCIRQKLSDLD